MTPRLGPEQQSRDWPYPTDLAPFLEAIRADPADDYDTRMRVDMFMMTPVARLMSAGLREALIDANLWQAPPRAPLHFRRTKRKGRGGGKLVTRMTSEPLSDVASAQITDAITLDQNARFPAGLRDHPDAGKTQGSI
jgi:hypothetical protein